LVRATSLWVLDVFVNVTLAITSSSLTFSFCVWVAECVLRSPSGRVWRVLCALSESQLPRLCVMKEKTTDMANHFRLGERRLLSGIM
jgi:hypothetical protein